MHLEDNLQVAGGAAAPFNMVPKQLFPLWLPCSEPQTPQWTGVSEISQLSEWTMSSPLSILS